MNKKVPQHDFLRWMFVEMLTLRKIVHRYIIRLECGAVSRDADLPQHRRYTGYNRTD